MSRCKHQRLVLLAGKDQKLRCRHCHLAIDQDELEDGFCPECYEVHGVKRRDFEKLEDPNKGEYRYRCEDCGSIISA